MLGYAGAFLPFRDSCHHLQRQEICSDCIILHPQNGLCQRTQLQTCQKEIGKSPSLWFLGLCHRFHCALIELIQPGGTPNLPVEVLGAPQCPQPRICLCQGVHRLGRAVSIFCGNLCGNLVELYTRDDKRCGVKKEFQAMKSSIFFLFFHDQLKKLVLVLKDGGCCAGAPEIWPWAGAAGKHWKRRVWWTVAVMISMILRIWSKGIISKDSKGCLGDPAAVGKQDQFSKKSLSQRRSRWTLWWRFLCQPSFVFWDDHPGSDALVDTALWCIMLHSSPFQKQRPSY